MLVFGHGLGVLISNHLQDVSRHVFEIGVRELELHLVFDFINYFDDIVFVEFGRVHLARLLLAIAVGFTGLQTEQVFFGSADLDVAVVLDKRCCLRVSQLVRHVRQRYLAYTLFKHCLFVFDCLPVYVRRELLTDALVRRIKALR